MMAGTGGNAPRGGVRLAPSGTFGAVVVSAGASDADFPSSAFADSDCAETVPTQSDAAKAAPAATAAACVNFIPHPPSSSAGEPVSPGCIADGSRTGKPDDPKQTLLLSTKG